MKKVLVTGGAGYIGSVLVRQLLSKGYYVRVLDSLKWGGESLYEVINNKNFHFQKGDIRLNTDIEQALEGIDYVSHLAAIVGDPACSKHPEEANQVNWEASVNLFNKSEEFGVNRFIFASTCSNYGKMDNSSNFVREGSPLNPISLYAKLKVKYENYILNEKKDSEMISTCLRLPPFMDFLLGLYLILR